MIHDLLIVSVFFLIFEPLFLKDKYIVFSPICIFFISFVFIYILPYYVFYISPNLSFVSTVSKESIFHGYLMVRLFFYSFVSVITYQLYKLKYNQRIVFRPLNYTFHYSWVFLLFGVFFLFFLFKLGLGVGFSPFAMLDRFLNPRAYTYIKSGLGPITFLYSAIILIFQVVITKSTFHKKNKLIYLALFFVFIIIMFGGSKSTVLRVFFLWILIYQKERFFSKSIKKKLSLLIKASLGLLLMLIIAFGLMSSQRSKLTNPIVIFEKIVEYQEEAEHTVRIVTDFNWKFEYFTVGIFDTVFNFVPRYFWTSKPYMSYFNRYWREKYKPGSVMYHTSTYGCVAEAYMFLGMLGPFIYGILYALVLSKVYRSFLHSTHFSMFIFNVMMISLIYFFVIVFLLNILAFELDVFTA